MDRQIKEEIDFYNKEKINAVADRLLGRPYVFIKDFIYHLRCIERYGKHDVRYWWHYYFYRKLSYKLGFQIPPHTVAVGMKIYHFWDYHY